MAISTRNQHWFYPSDFPPSHVSLHDLIWSLNFKLNSQVLCHCHKHEAYRQMLAKDLQHAYAKECHQGDREVMLLWSDGTMDVVDLPPEINNFGDAQRYIMKHCSLYFRHRPAGKMKCFLPDFPEPESKIETHTAMPSHKSLLDIQRDFHEADRVNGLIVDALLSDDDDDEDDTDD